MPYILASSILVVLATVVAIGLTTVKIRRNRSRLVNIERTVGLPDYVPPVWQCRGLLNVIRFQWWAYGPLLALAALAYFNQGAGLWMWALLCAAAFWVVSGAVEDINAY